MRRVSEMTPTQYPKPEPPLYRYFYTTSVSYLMILFGGPSTRRTSFSDMPVLICARQASARSMGR